MCGKRGRMMMLVVKIVITDKVYEKKTYGEDYVG
jgi:hypothetical protein